MLRFLAYTVECFHWNENPIGEIFEYKCQGMLMNPLFLKYPSRDVKYYVTSMESTKL